MKWSKTQLILYPLHSLLFPVLVYLLQVLDSRLWRPSLAIGIMSGLVGILLIAYSFIGIFWLKGVYDYFVTQSKTKGENSRMKN